MIAISSDFYLETHGFNNENEKSSLWVKVFRWKIQTLANEKSFKFVFHIIFGTIKLRQS
jgi:hypothetical protein